MALKTIITEPNKILRQVSIPVEKVGDEERKLMKDMLKTMYEAPGIGLAAIQIGILKRIVVIDISKDEEKKSPLFLINPEITFRSKKTSVYEEGCLSVPDKVNRVPRQTRVKVSYMCYHGKRLEKTFYDLSAIIIQHEIDHMNGKLCIDY